VLHLRLLIGSANFRSEKPKLMICRPQQARTQNGSLRKNDKLQEVV